MFDILFMLCYNILVNNKRKDYLLKRRKHMQLKNKTLSNYDVKLSISDDHKASMLVGKIKNVCDYLNATK